MATSLDEIIESGPFPIAKYDVDVQWWWLDRWLEDASAYPAEMDPPFQRAHVWTREQQIAFCEYAILGGPSGRHILWAAQGWNSGEEKRGLLLVDGKQRLNAVRMMMANKLPVFGKTVEEWQSQQFRRMRYTFKMVVADISEADAVRWYIALNRGATPHTSDEIGKAEAYLASIAGDRSP